MVGYWILINTGLCPSLELKLLSSPCLNLEQLLRVGKSWSELWLGLVTIQIFFVLIAGYSHLIHYLELEKKCLVTEKNISLSKVHCTTKLFIIYKHQVSQRCN